MNPNVAASVDDSVDRTYTCKQNDGASISRVTIPEIPIPRIKTADTTYNVMREPAIDSVHMEIENVAAEHPPMATRNSKCWRMMDPCLFNDGSLKFYNLYSSLVCALS